MNKRGTRLDRFLGATTGMSRRLAQQAIRAGDVLVDGKPVVDPSVHVAPEARVEFEGGALAAPQTQYWMLHKPVGMVCAARDSAYRTVFECVEVPPSVTLHVAGRLDVDATGLVLLTDDGEWSHRVTSPRYKFEKIYRVTLAEPLSDTAQKQLHAGVSLEGEPKPCKPAGLDRIADLEWRITIGEGKYHQVKRMLAAVGNRVVTLHRERIGPVALDPALAPGDARRLTAAEVGGFDSRMTT